MVKESGKGVIIKGWAPQTVILKHASEKVKILADMAKKAVEIGGSSDCDLKSLLNDLREYKRTRDNGLLNR
ncbi:hypothetical protein LINGRAHAP2_LOCUS10295 [Linum grandiflorum]